MVGVVVVFVEWFVFVGIDDCVCGVNGNVFVGVIFEYDFYNGFFSVLMRSGSYS